MTRESRSSKNRAIVAPRWFLAVKTSGSAKSIINHQQSKISNQKSEMTLVPRNSEPTDYEVQLGLNIFPRCCSQLLVPLCRDWGISTLVEGCIGTRKCIQDIVVV
jgi:hypothetical protein